MNKFILMCGLLAISACEKKYEDQVKDIEKLFSKGKVGTSPDFYLVKSGLAGPDKVAVVFGYLDDYDVCSELAKLYMQKYPSDTYYCQAANQ